jgi:hypothetical protein
MVVAEIAQLSTTFYFSRLYEIVDDGLVEQTESDSIVPTVHG